MRKTTRKKTKRSIASTTPGGVVGVGVGDVVVACSSLVSRLTFALKKRKSVN
jgi:hypothetical protein